MKEIVCHGRAFIDIGYGLDAFKLSFETVRDDGKLLVNFTGSDETICELELDDETDVKEASVMAIVDATEKRKVRRKIRDYVLEHYLMIRL